MKSYLLIGLAIATTFSAFGKSASKSIETLRRRGLKGAITVFVSDSSGNPIAEAEVHMFFENGRGKDGYEEVKALTDSSGKAQAKGRIRISAIVAVRKNGYHRFRKEYAYLTLDPTKMDGDKWRPYERVLKITLLERKRVASFESFHGYIRFPLSTNDFNVFLTRKGFREASIKPTGRDIASFSVHWDCKRDEQGGRKRLTIQSREGFGFIVMEKGEESSGMIYPYEFPTNGYESCYTYEDIWQGRDRKTTKFDRKTEFLAFKLPFLGCGYDKSVADTAWGPKWFKRYVEANGETPMPETQYGLILYLDLGVDYEKGEGTLEFDGLLNYDYPDDPACEYDRF